MMFSTYSKGTKATNTRKNSPPVAGQAILNRTPLNKERNKSLNFFTI